MTKKQQMKQNTKEWYLYHHIDNENALLYVIVFSFLSLFIKSGSLIFICIWLWYAYYCNKNNRILDNDPKTLKEREFWKQIHIKNGDWEECKQILGIK